MTSVAVGILLAVGVLAGWVGAAGLVLLKDRFDRLHAVGFLTVASGLFVTLAVVVHEWPSVLALKQIVLLVAAVGIGGVLTHSIARTMRIRGRDDEP